jgi:hypothetical protein
MGRQERRLQMASSYTDDQVIKIPYGGVVLDQYNGKFSLVKVKVGKDEKTWWPQWVFEQRWRDGKKEVSEKSYPHKLELGDQAEAIEILTLLLKRFGVGGGGVNTPSPNKDTKVEDQIPF